MHRIVFKNGKKQVSILQIYTFSFLLFTILSLLGVYKYKVYDTWSLVVFYLYAFILWLGIKVGRDTTERFSLCIKSRYGNKSQGWSERSSFILNRQGLIIVYLLFIASVISFGYFLVLYRGSFNIASFGSSLKAEYDEVARTKLEVISLFVMYAGSATYLIVYGSKDSVSRFTLRMARICLFLPGLRGAFLGRRFTLAVETLLFIFAERESISNKIEEMDLNSKRTMRRIAVVFVAVVILLLYIFSQRIVYFPDTLFIAYPGDMELKQFWKWVYSQIGDRMSIIAYVSFYAGHAPYSFSYSYSNLYLDFPQYWGLQTCRVLIQIITNLFGIHPNYAEMARQVPGIARYASYAGATISDFGVYLAPFVSFLFGFIFGRIERKRNMSSLCHSLYPIVQVWCFFAPVYYFTVGVLDQVAFWTVILSLLCLSQCYLGEIEDNIT